MPVAVLFDLDNTLVDSSGAESLREQRQWLTIAQSPGLIKSVSMPYLSESRKINELHMITAQLRALGYRVAVVTSSPRSYAEHVLKSHKIEHDLLVSYEDTERHKPDPEPISTALARLGVQAKDAYYVGDDRIDVISSYYAGVTSITPRWGIKDFGVFSSMASDFLIDHPGLLRNLSLLRHRGYLGEVICAGLEPLPLWGSILRCDDQGSKFALGRYFGSQDPRHGSSAYSKKILQLKTDDSASETFWIALGRFLVMRPSYDYITCVPPKPSQTRNRFGSILENVRPWINPETQIVSNGLECVNENSDYRNLNAAARGNRIQGAFRTSMKWSGSVLLIDDVLTTGSTTSECTKVLRNSGARSVHVLALAKTQTQPPPTRCPKCNRQLIRRSRRSDGHIFWGCAGFASEGCDYTFNYY